MDLREPRRATLVVIEAGATWPKWLDPSRSGDMVVVVQSADGQNAPLIDQVATRSAELVAAGWLLVKIVLVANSRSEVEAATARSNVARALIARLKGGRARELVLSTDQLAGSGVHQGLIALAAVLDAGGLEVSVHVGSGDRLYESSHPAPAPRAL